MVVRFTPEGIDAAEELLNVGLLQPAESELLYHLDIERPLDAVRVVQINEFTHCAKLDFFDIAGPVPTQLPIVGERKLNLHSGFK